MRYVLAVLCLALAGCTANGIDLTAALQQREVTSCLWYSGAATPYASVIGVTATGGATLEQCLAARHP